MIFIAGMMLVLYGCISLWGLKKAWYWFDRRIGIAMAHFVIGVVFGGAFFRTLYYFIGLFS